MSFALYFPDEVTDEESWIPSCDPVDYSLPENDGILAHLMADGTTMAAYQIAPATDLYIFRFRWLTSTDRTALRAFKAAALGNTFKMRHPLTDDLETVTFDVDGGFNLRWETEGPYLALTLPLRKAG